jgi:phosphoserine phosphatase
MVAEETLDELAAYAGIKDKIAAITARAMNGVVDFEAALRERVALLKGLPESALHETAAKMTFTPGGRELLIALKKSGAHCVLVSGGFTFFTAKVAAALGFQANHGNTLVVENGALTGTVGDPILDKTFKKTCLENTAKHLGIDITQTVAIGDGANDLPMLQAAGLGVGFHSKPVLREALDNHLLFNGLDGLTYALGLTA